MSSFLDNIKIFFVVLIVFLAIDLPYILLINNKPYEEMFSKINNKDSPSGTNVYINAAICYVLLAIGIQYFGVSSNSYLGSIIFGLCVFGIYNTTNLATIKNYDQKVAAMDVAWGTFLCLLVMIISSLISNNFILGGKGKVELSTEEGSESTN
jgi:uncharacterized membrane protein